MYGIFAYIWLIFMGNVDNIPYMDPMGIGNKEFLFFELWSFQTFDLMGPNSLKNKIISLNQTVLGDILSILKSWNIRRMI